LSATLIFSPYGEKMQTNPSYVVLPSQQLLGMPATTPPDRLRLPTSPYTGEALVRCAQQFLGTAGRAWYNEQKAVMA